MEKGKVLDPIMNTKFYKDYLRKLSKGRKYAIKKAIELSKLKDNKRYEITTRRL